MGSRWEVLVKPGGKVKAGRHSARTSRGEFDALVPLGIERGAGDPGAEAVFGCFGAGVKVRVERGEKRSSDAAHNRELLWRPFTKLRVDLDGALSAGAGVMRDAFPVAATEAENVVICCAAGSRIPFFVQAARGVVHGGAGGGACTCFPFYTYDEAGAHRRENISDWALDQFRAHYADPVISKWSIFDYVYGVLHHPGYRERFADNLKRELPRIPLAPDFRAFQKAGQRLIELHLDYEKLEPYPLTFEETPGRPVSYRVKDKMRLSKDKGRLTVNSSLTLSGIPAAALGYRLGNRSALEWMVDQYRVQTGARSGVVSDPNRAEDPEYIVRLVGQVVRVSVETGGIVGELSSCQMSKG